MFYACIIGQEGRETNNKGDRAMLRATEKVLNNGYGNALDILAALGDAVGLIVEHSGDAEIICLTPEATHAIETARAIYGIAKLDVRLDR
jgi:hypothetical protein